MSGAIARIGGVSAIASSVLGLNESTIVLGGFTFTGFDMPERVQWGVRQRLHRHVLPGGAIVVDTLGPDYPPIVWQGVFFGPRAQARARAVAAMARSGGLQALTWLDQTWLVVVRDFHCADMTASLASYRIACDVVVDPTKFGGQPRQSLADRIMSDVNDALGFDVGAALDQAMELIEAVELVAGAAGAFAPGSAANRDLTAAAAAADAAMAATVPVAEAALPAPPPERPRPDDVARWIADASAQAETLAQATAIGGYLGRINATLAEG